MKQPSKRFEPDVRFLLANERTLLAWIRTSIALQAGGIVLAGLETDNLSAQKAFGLVIIAIGGLTALIGYYRFRDADRAIRAEKLPTTGIMPALGAASLITIAAALIALIVVSSR